MRRWWLLLILFILFSPFVYSANNIECSVMTNPLLCDSSLGKIKVLYFQNGTGGNINAHASLPSNPSYSNFVCCWPSGTPDGLNTNCDDSTFLRLSNGTNAHVQEGNLSSYLYPACLSATINEVRCSFYDTCPLDYTPLISISGDTNAHVGVPNHYDIQVCCNIVIAPSQDPGGSGSGSDSRGGTLTCPFGEHEEDGYCVKDTIQDIEDEINETKTALGDTIDLIQEKAPIIYDGLKTTGSSLWNLFTKQNYFSILLAVIIFFSGYNKSLKKFSRTHTILSSVLLMIGTLVWWWPFISKEVTWVYLQSRTIPIMILFVLLGGYLLITGYVKKTKSFKKPNLFFGLLSFAMVIVGYLNIPQKITFSILNNSLAFLVLCTTFLVLGYDKKKYVSPSKKGLKKDLSRFNKTYVWLAFTFAFLRFYEIWTKPLFKGVVYFNDILKGFPMIWVFFIGGLLFLGISYKKETKSFSKVPFIMGLSSIILFLFHIFNIESLHLTTMLWMIAGLILYVGWNPNRKRVDNFNLILSGGIILLLLINTFKPYLNHPTFSLYPLLWITSIYLLYKGYNPSNKKMKNTNLFISFFLIALLLIRYIGGKIGLTFIQEIMDNINSYITHIGTFIGVGDSLIVGYITFAFLVYMGVWFYHNFNTKNSVLNG